MMPSPFCRGVFVCGEPIEVAHDADEAAMEAARLLLEQRLTEVQDEADRLLGLTPIEPASKDAKAKVKR